MFGLPWKMQKKQILLKLVGNLCILKLFNFCREKKIKQNEFEETYKNNLLTLIN